MDHTGFLKESVLLGNELWRYLGVFLFLFVSFFGNRISRYLLKPRAEAFHNVTEKALYGVLWEMLMGFEETTGTASSWNNRLAWSKWPKR